SDIYSFGLIIYEMLVGHVPFTGASATEIMLKHLQEPPPSVLAERADLPAAVGAVVARALAKRREDRQQSAGELAEELAAAATEDVVPVVGAEVGRTTGEQPGISADRIVVPTGAQELRTSASEDYDEATVVPAAPHADEHHELDELAAYDAPPPAATFNPWKIMIPAAVALVLVLGVFFAMSQRNAPTAGNDNNAPLATDPNARAVQPLNPPTGASEKAIAPNAAPTVSPSPGAANPPTAAGLPEVNDNSAARPAANERERNDNSNAVRNNNARGNRQANDNQAQNDNENTEAEPTPTLNKNKNPRVRPTPTPNNNDNDLPPPPTPTPPRRRPTPTPTPTPPPSAQTFL
ncbi:MAG TPA: hypothetical protein VE821_03765, partial [Pyrinomonadaceae bacterium]|nr:hypothetical protein [Pyrinomonadaceae bacterium]